jgi:hypothetical protein
MSGFVGDREHTRDGVGAIIHENQLRLAGLTSRGYCPRAVFLGEEGLATAHGFEP